jgi:PAS domain S-box-containing protein
MFLTPIGIQKRTVAAILGTVLPVFAAFSVGLMIYRHSLLQTRVQQTLAPYAELIGVSAAPAVDIGDKDRALEILNSLKANPHIAGAEIIQPDGETLATYPGNQPPLPPAAWNRPDGAYVQAGTGELVRSFAVSDSRPARLCIRMSLAGLMQREWQALTDLWVAVGLTLSLFAWLQFGLLRRWVLSPLGQLAAIAESAGRQGDYSARMPAHNRDELGQLGKRFNALLAAVEQRETALRQMAGFQRAIWNDAAYAIISTDTAGRITSFNPAAEKLLGWQAGELVGQATPEIFLLPEEIAARAKALSAQTGQPLAPGFAALVAEARDGLRSDGEWNCRCKDGTRVPVRLSVTALRDERGEIFGFLGMAADITQQRQAAARLREREAQYRLLFENMVTGFALHEVVCDAEGQPVDYRYLEVNPAFEQLTGLTAAELVGRTVSEALPAVEKYWIKLFGEVALTGKPVAYENFFSDLGKYYDTWVFSPKRGQFAVVFSDITARKQAEESLHESRRLYEELVASVPLGVFRLVVKGADSFAFAYVSERFCELTGLARSAVLADAAALSGIIAREDREAFDRRKSAAVRQPGPFNWEGRVTVRGKGRWLHLESRPTLLPGRPPFWTGFILDVTDRQRVEEALHQQHSLLEGALQATADGILAVSSAGRITSYNRQFLELWQAPPEILEAHDTAGLAEYILRQLRDPEAMQAHIRNFNDPGKADTFDTLEFADGRVYERFSRPQLVAGHVVGRVWSFRDVTARHRAIASLRESEHKFKMLFESANDAILLMNDAVILDCNQVTETVYGCPRDQIIGQSPAHFSPERQPDGRQSSAGIAEKIRAARAGAPQFFEWIHTRRDGTLFNAEVSLNRLELRGQGVIQAIVRDVTERKMAEAAQHEAEQLYRTLVNTSPDGICLLDMKGRVLYASPKALELFYGAAQAEPPPEERTALNFVGKQHRARAARLFRGGRSGAFPANERLVMRRSDGHEFVAELTGTRLRDAEGVPWGILVIVRDVTERQRQEDELKSKNTELERFTYTVSHDLRSPLITIKGFAGALLADAQAGRTDRLRPDLARIGQAADKMSDLLNGLLRLSRVGRIVNPPAEVSMAALAQDVLDLLAGSIAQHHATVRIQPGLPNAFGDAQRLQEVLQNLLENALKFSAPGRAPEIELGFKLDGDLPVYFVRDQGRGIEHRFQESIFGLFNKLDPRTDGTGIGLALARRIVEFHGGSIWVESAGPDQGATFYFTLAARKALSTGSADQTKI